MNDGQSQFEGSGELALRVGSLGLFVGQQMARIEQSNSARVPRLLRFGGVTLPRLGLPLEGRLKE